jgi:UDP-3-O-[3-hydroxymyristoyl] glucosamine N-acyltransferase
MKAPKIDAPENALVIIDSGDLAMAVLHNESAAQFVCDDTKAARKRGLTVAGDTDLLTEEAFITENRLFAALDNAEMRERQIERIHDAWVDAKKPDLKLHTSIHKSVIGGDDATIAENTLIGPGCILGREVVIGMGCVIGAGTVIGADVVIGDYSEIGAGSVIGAGAKIGKRVSLGLAARVADRYVITDGMKIKPGAMLAYV